jgi:protein-tyrosine phosphatase
MNYNWIDQNVAIGNRLSSYDPFDVIVNLNYPYNNVKHNAIEMSNEDGKIIYRVGINDSPDEPMFDLISIIIPDLVYLYRKNNNIKILFHCYAGISRSSTLAIAFLSLAKGYTPTYSYQISKYKRNIIQPNEGFIRALKKYFLLKEF